MTAAPRHKVLVIDDERGPRESLRILLKNEYDVVTAESVDIGMRHLIHEPQDVIILDIRMPGKSGIEGLRLIRELDPHVAVIMLTGFGALETAQEAMRHGANDYLKKPFDAVEMLDAIRRNIERTNLQRKRAQTASELEALNRHLLAEMSEKERLASLGQASAEFVHDLRNPLSVVLGYVDLLHEELKKAHAGPGQSMGEAADYIDAIHRNALRCKELADMWQNLGKRTDGPLQAVSVADLFAEICPSAKLQAAEKKAKLECAPVPEGLAMRADSIQLARALQNAIANALDAVEGRPDGSVGVSCVEQGGQVFIRVADNGCGMSPEQVSKAFEPYFTTKGIRKGTGLGLFISRKVVEDCGGSVEIQSRQGAGTVLTIRLPVAE